MTDIDDDEVSELTELDVTKVSGVEHPATGTPFLLLKSAAQASRGAKDAGGNHVLIGERRRQRLAKAAGETETPAMGPGEADAIMRAVTGEGVDTCAAPTADGTPCQRPAVAGGRCHMHATKGKTVTRKELFKKTQRDPFKALGEIEALASQLPVQHPARIQAAGLVLRCKLQAAHAGSKSSAIEALSKSGIASTITDSWAEVQAAVAPYQAGALAPSPPGPSAADQLQQVWDGTGESQTLAGTQNADALAHYTSPSAALGQVLKDGERRLEAAQAAFDLAKAQGTAGQISAAAEALTLAKLSLFHKAAGALR